MQHRGHDDRNRVDPADQFGRIGERLDPVLGGDRLAGGRVRIDDAHEIGLGQAGVFLGVIAAEMAAADDGGAKLAHARSYPVLPTGAKAASGAFSAAEKGE
jgi:hypothetical protein